MGTGACVYFSRISEGLFLRKGNGQIHVFFLNKKKDYALKERSSGVWNEVRAESGCTRGKDLGWFEEEEQTTEIC